MAGWDDDNPSGFGVESDVETAIALDRANSETGLALEDAEPRAPSPVDFDIPALRTHSCAYVCELSELLVEQAKTAAAKPAATTTAEGYAHWLAAFWFAAQQRIPQHSYRASDLPPLKRQLVERDHVVAGRRSWWR